MAGGPVGTRPYYFAARRNYRSPGPIASLRAAVRKDWTEKPFISFGKLLAHGRVVHDTATGLDTEDKAVLLKSGSALGTAWP
jgi:hypothetical protein